VPILSHLQTQHITVLWNNLDRQRSVWTICWPRREAFTSQKPIPQAPKARPEKGNHIRRWCFGICQGALLTQFFRFGKVSIDTNAASRSVSDSVVTLKPLGGTSNINPRPMPTTAPPHLQDMARPPPRTSSIDSAISTISTHTSSQKGTENVKSASPEDVASLIRATGGSPEALIQHLLKEKQGQAAQNAQLWRLVDKQRAMILGLNKDLERALKDKERYRKKLKESLAQMSNPSPVDSTQGRAGSDAGSIISDFKPTEKSSLENVGSMVSASLRDPPGQDDHPPSPIDVALAPYPITPPANLAPSQTPVLANLVEAEHKMPSPTQHAFQQYNPDASSTSEFESSQLQKKTNELAREVPYNASLPPSRSLPSNPPRGPPPNIPPPKAPMSSQTPSLSVIEPSPNPDEGLRAFPPPPRKAPPAPLNLGKKAVASSHLRQASGTGEDSDSDYDDILEVDEIPAFPERGRRKTREADDREREQAAMREAELRSLSKKSQGSAKAISKSGTTTPKDGVVDPVPTKHRPTVPIAPPDAHLQHMSPGSNSGSLAGMLSDSSEPIVTRVLSPPLMSPGLPLSPRPIDRGMSSPLPRNPSGNNSAFSSPPLSPRGMGAFPGAIPLSPRAPRQPIPLPPGTPMSITSPGLPRGEPLQLVSPRPLMLSKMAKEDGNNDESPTRDSPPSSIYRGLVTDEYPDLLLAPNALPSIDVKVASSRLKPSRSSLMFPKNFEEDPVFTLAVHSRSDGHELWRVEKDSSSLARLDQQLKQSATFTARTPDRSLFSGHAPAKVDARRAALDTYLDEMLNTQMDLTSALEVCKYLSTNTLAPHKEDFTPDSPNASPTKTGPGGRPLKDGYLTKRGKNFGGWKARYFVLDGPIFKYYESPGGPHLGTIKLSSAQIGKQQQQTDHSPSRGEADDPENQYRHAFLILEPKRKDSSSLVRHVLCAENDEERDEWVDALLKYVDIKDPEDEEHRNREHTRTSSGGSGHVGKPKKKTHGIDRSQTLPDLQEDGLRGVSYENTKQGNIPQNVRHKMSGTPSPPTYGREKDPMSQIPHSQSAKNISAPKNAHVIQDSGIWGNKQNMLAPVSDVKAKKRSFFGFGSKPRASTENQDAGGNDGQSNLSQMAYEQHGPIRPAFGATLGEAVRFNHPADVNIELPAVVYRCIEYLDAKNAAGEEGIFRLSGSNVVIKQLRERFNTEGDVNLVTDDQYYDIHAVASLLKLYLRELPSTILTRELHLEFLAVTELTDVNDKVSALNGLVYRLPRANNALLRYLSGFLINIINHADTNKMTVRNVGIVFSPTLNIPAPVFALFLQQYDGIFGEDPHDQPGSPVVEISVSAPPLSPDDIRSPRRQKFQDLPTPSYNQQTFAQSMSPLSFPQAPSSFSQPQGRQQPGYETGFTPLQPAYEQQTIGSFPLMAGPEYGRLGSAPTLAGPAYDQYASSSAPVPKSKRRESTMFGLGASMGGHRKASNQQTRAADGRK
jgi:RalA-binding protein 1